MTQAYDPATQAAFDELERQILAQRSAVVPPSIYREADIPNPYYNMPGSREAYEQYGIPPVLVQNQPYATAAYRTMPNGSVAPLVGYPSVYPHVLNGVPQDYAAPYIMGGGGFAAGGTYGYDPNVAVQQAQMMLSRAMQGNVGSAPRVGNVQPPQQAVPSIVPPVNNTSEFPGLAPAHVPGAIPPPTLPPSTPGTFPGLAPAHVPQMVPQMAPVHTPGVIPEGGRTPLPEQLPAPALQPLMRGGVRNVPDLIMPPVSPGAAAPPAVPPQVATVAPIDTLSTAAQLGAMVPASSAVNYSQLSPSQQFQWNRFLDTGIWDSTLYNTPADFAAAYGLSIPENRVPQMSSAANTELMRNQTSVPDLPTVAQQREQIPQVSLADYQAAQQALSAIYNDPNATWEDQLQARMLSVYLPQIYLAQQTGDSIGQFGDDLARELAKGPNQQTRAAASMLFGPPMPVRVPGF